MGYPRKSQTVTATPAKPGELSILLGALGLDMIVSQTVAAIKAAIARR